MTGVQTCALPIYPVFAGALARAVHGLGDGWQVHVSQSIAQAMEALEASGGDLQLALVDMHLPDGSGLEVIRALGQRHPDVPALVVSSLSSERSVIDAIAAGARGYLNKDEPVEMLTDSISQVLQGHCPISPSLARHLFKRVQGGSAIADSLPVQLTPKETETLRCISRGLSYNEAAGQMGISLSTIQSHIRSLYRKLEVRSQVQAVGKARERSLL